MNTRPRLLFGSFVSAGARMSGKTTKPPTHYETLQVSHRATQGEIKTAYFKLSKEYHPDRNSSEAATVKFREITEAYEVLGSFQSRKSYDRSVLTQTRYQDPRRGDGRPYDPKIREYQAQAAIFRDQQKTGSTPSYDFDAWTKAHYGRTLNRTFRDRAEGTRRRLAREDTFRPNAGLSDVSMIWVAVTLLTVIMMIGWRSNEYDDPTLLVNRQQQLEARSTSETLSNLENESLLTK